MRGVRAICVSAFLLAMTVALWGQAAPAAPTTSNTGAPDAEQALRERVRAYYTATMRGDRAQASEFVAPQSRADFDTVDMRGLAGASIESVKVAPSGDSAVVTTLRSFTAPVRMDMPWDENWSKIDGQWYLVLPDMHATPFGRMERSTTPPDPEAMRKLADKQQKNVDMDQYQKALEKVWREEQKKLAADVEAAEQQKKAAAAQETAKKCAAQAGAKKKSKSKKAADDACARTAQAQPASK